MAKSGRLAERMSAGYQKVAAAQGQKVAAGEAQLQRQQQGMQAAGQALQQQGAQQQQQEQFDTQMGERKQQRIQQEGQFQQSQQQQQEQFEARQGMAEEELRVKEGIEAQKMDLAQQEIEVSKIREKRLSQAAQIKDVEAKQVHFDKRKTFYSGEINKLRTARDKLMVGDQGALDLTSAYMAKIPGLKDNKVFQNAISGAKAGDPAAVQEVVQALDNAMVKTMVDQAGEIGDWNPPPHFVSNPEVQQFNSYLVQSKVEANSRLQDVIMSLQSNPKGASDYVKLLGTPEDRDRRLVKSAYMKMRMWYQAQNLRAGVQRYNQQNPQQQVTPESVAPKNE